ncbi:hypothetical protein O181_003775 [Austropuccinia psidii MF-1]|uniref:Reverse transcriptase Ty1/copia-type domain-containing protein n=1 Tax=Austropuccinia psidii MF-1 TaxID=1389203 RepID=A0A9Q3BF27_9BASI|nr:hypothetical protein [Austropuccinia psidii MF-1]
MTLGEVPTESIFAEETTAVNSLPQHLGQALCGPNQHHWKEVCMAELAQMERWDVWEVVNKEKGMKTIGHQWVFDMKRQDDGSVKKFKAHLVARGNRQPPGIDCTETYAPMASLMFLCLILTKACLRKWPVDLFDVSGAYLYSPIKAVVLLDPLTSFLPDLEGKVL